MKLHCNCSLVFDEACIRKALQRLADAIVAHYGAQGERVMVLVLMDGALWFAADLLRLLPTRFVMQSLLVRSYHENRSSSGRLTWQSPIPDVQGRQVLLLDEVIDTGLTLSEVHQVLAQHGASELKSVVLINKRPCRLCDYEADFVGLEAGDDYLIGYGLDDAGLYRNLPYVAKLSSNR